MTSSCVPQQRGERIHLHRVRIHLHRGRIHPHRARIHPHRARIHLHRARIHLHRGRIYLHRARIHLHRVRIYLHRLARCRSSAHPPCRCGSGRPPAGSRAGRYSRSGNPSARLLSTRRSPAAPRAARGTGFLGWREQRGRGSGCRPCGWAEPPGLGAVGALAGPGALTSAVGHPRPVAAGQALHGAGTHQAVAAGAAQLAARPQAAAVGAAPRGVAGGLSAVDAERGAPLGHCGRAGS